MKKIQETPTIEIKLIEEIGDLDNLEIGDYISLDGPAGSSIPGIFAGREDANSFYVFEIAMTGRLGEVLREIPVKAKHQFIDRVKYPIVTNEDFIPLDETTQEYTSLINMLKEVFSEE